MSNQDYPTWEEPEEQPPLIVYVIALVFIATLLIAILVIVYWMLAWVFAPLLTITPGSCVAPVCAAIVMREGIPAIGTTDFDKWLTAWHKEHNPQPTPRVRETHWYKRVSCDWRTPQETDTTNPDKVTCKLCKSRMN